MGLARLGDGLAADRRLLRILYAQLAKHGKYARLITGLLSEAVISWPLSEDWGSIMLISMATRRFHHLGQEWEAVGTGTGHGVGFGYLPNVDRWGVILRSVSNPQQGDYRYRGTMSQSDPNAVDLEELRRVLEEVLTIAAIDRSRFTWRTAEGIAEETGIPIVRVREILDTTSEADVMQSDEANPQGHDLFTTRDHFVKTTGDVSKRYADVERST